MYLRLLTRVGLPICTQKSLICMPGVIVACVANKYSTSTVDDSTSGPELAVDARDQRTMTQKDGEDGLDCLNKGGRESALHSHFLQEMSESRDELRDDRAGTVINCRFFGQSRKHRPFA